jgi:hypothetical protein
LEDDREDDVFPPGVGDSVGDFGLLFLPLGGVDSLNQIGRREGVTGIDMRALMMCVRGFVRGLGEVGGSE